VTYFHLLLPLCALGSHPHHISVESHPQGAVTVPHASEIEYVFGDVPALTPGEEANLAVPMATHWWTFAVTGDPNPATMPSGMVQWPKFETKSDTTIVFDVPSHTEYGGNGIHTTTGLRKAVCDYNENGQQQL
jgi:carboxylesterase type B